MLTELRTFQLHLKVSARDRKFEIIDQFTSILKKLDLILYIIPLLCSASWITVLFIVELYRINIIINKADLEFGIQKMVSNEIRTKRSEISSLNSHLHDL